MRHIVMTVVLAVAPALGNAQGNDLDQAAEKARQAWFAHNTAALVAESPRLLIPLPGAEPSVALGPDQAAALLSNFLSNGQEVETVVRAAREVAPSQGYVELQRKYRVVGTQNVRTQVLLLGYRRSQGGWTLVEFRAVG
ncbi:MAG TPA: hypothetical protein VMS62_09460 [Gemmatimonadales bacterium]|nr:hypothetical protein [Gemmatimonadales bacterium]